MCNNTHYFNNADVGLYCKRKGANNDPPKKNCLYALQRVCARAGKTTAVVVTIGRVACSVCECACVCVWQTVWIFQEG